MIKKIVFLLTIFISSNMLSNYVDPVGGVVSASWGGQPNFMTFQALPLNYILASGGAAEGSYYDIYINSGRMYN